MRSDSANAAGEDLGLTVSSFKCVSLDPPLALFSISRTAHSLPKWEKCEGFAINVLTRKQAHLSTKFATALSDKLKDVQFERGLNGAPIERPADSCGCGRFLALPSIRAARRRRPPSIHRARYEIQHGAKTFALGALHGKILRT